MTIYRSIKKNFGVICLWIASIILAYNYSAYKTRLSIDGLDNIKSQLSKDFQIAPQITEDSKVYYDKNGNQIHPNTMILNDGTHYHYNHTTPIIFIGGMPRSGTTLMRVMLDAHGEVRCGEETRLVPRLLGMRSNWYRSEKEKTRLQEAGVTDNVIDEAMKQFLLEVIVRHGQPNTYLCNKDPFTLKSQVYLKKLFPNAKFILMIRDGRATAHSIIERKVTISGFDITSYKDVLTKWNKAIDTMYQQCMDFPDSCLPVWYEQLVLHPQENLKKISKFLNLPWDEKMMHHEQHTNQIKISAVEKSTDQVQKPLYLDALTAWNGHIPDDVDENLEDIAPMLGKLGYKYDMGSKPSYGVPDQSVLDNLKAQEFNHEWAKDKQ